MPRPKMDPSEEQHRPHREDDEEQENGVSELFRRELTTPPSTPRRAPPEVRISEVKVATAASNKRFPMWLGETKQSYVVVTLAALSAGKTRGERSIFFSVGAAQSWELFM